METADSQEKTLEPTSMTSTLARKKALFKKDAANEGQKKRERKTTDQFVGRRKTSVARVSLHPGSGKIVINNREINEYFPRPDLRASVIQPLLLTEVQGQVDVKVNVYGGGITGQAQAIALGIARSLDRADSAHHSKLKAAGLFTRDPRMVERKKYGFHKARRSTQFSKR